VRPKRSNVEAIQRIEAPITVKALQSFLGSVNFYMKFVPDFSLLTQPLRALLKADSSFEWSAECQTAFETLKQRISSAPILAHFDVKAATIVSTDASASALGAVLTQLHNRAERPVAFASRALNSAGQNYSASEREALACIWACEHWHYFLYGRHFTIRTDHSPLTALLGVSGKGHKPMRLLRWADRLQQYDFDVVFRPGRDNHLPDLLSRSPARVEADAVPEPESAEIATVFGNPAIGTLTVENVREATLLDADLSKVLQFVRHG